MRWRFSTASGLVHGTARGGGGMPGLPGGGPCCHLSRIRDGGGGGFGTGLALVAMILILVQGMHAPAAATAATAVESPTVSTAERLSPFVTVRLTPQLPKESPKLPTSPSMFLCDDVGKPCAIMLANICLTRSESGWRPERFVSARISLRAFFVSVASSGSVSDPPYAVSPITLSLSEQPASLSRRAHIVLTGDEGAATADEDEAHAIGVVIDAVKSGLRFRQYTLKR
jgi:hypothetical protein